jgi:DNA-binding MarR family transcriptional regulator
MLVVESWRKSIVDQSDKKWERADPLSQGFSMSQSPLYWLARVSNQYQLSMEEQLKRVGMDVPRWRVLMILSEHEPTSVTGLCEHAIVRMPTMTKIVQRMVDAGLVVSDARQNDRRITDVRLTAHGHEVVKVVRERASRIYRLTFSEVTGDEVEVLTNLLQRLFRNLND